MLSKETKIFLFAEKTGPLYYDGLKQKIVCIFLITKDEKLRVNQSSMKLWSSFYFCFYFIGFFKFMDYLFTNGYHFELSRKNDYPLTSNRKCTYPLAKSGLAHSTNYGMNLLSQENAE